MALPAGVLPGHKLTQRHEIRPSDEFWARESGFPVGLYIRISTDSDLQKTSLGNQEKVVRAWCADPAHHYPVHDVYIDDARSGAYMTNRPEVQRLLADAAAGRIRGIVTKEISRVSRDVLDTLSIKRSLEQVGACYIDMVHNYDSRKDGDELFLVMYGVIAQKERKTTGRRVAMTMQQKAREGRNPVIHPPFGYGKEGDTLVPDPAAAPLYREMVARFCIGWGKKRICHWLNEAGIRTGRGKAWTPASLTVVLRNSVYLGHTFWGTAKIVKGAAGRAAVVARPEGEWIFRENTHAPLIDRAQWDEVQALLTQRATGAEGGKRTKRYPLVGYLRCGACGSHLYGHRFTKRPKHRPPYHNCYYTCQQEHGRCRLPYQRCERLEGAVNQAIRELVADPALIRRQVAAKAHLYVAGLDELKAVRSAAAAKLERLVAGSRQLGVDRALNTITEREFGEQMAAIRSLRAELEAELAGLERRLGAADRREAQAARIAAAVQELLSAADPEAAAVMEQLYFLLLRRVTVHPDGGLQIDWRFDPE